jgi:hypothetical protein
MARPARSPSLSLETIDERRASLAAIGPALAKDGEVLLWSCETGRGARGAAFLAALAQASGASVAAASAGSATPRRGGGWALDGAALRAPLTRAGDRRLYRGDGGDQLAGAQRLKGQAG